VIGWSLKPRMTADLVTDALTMAWFRRRPESGVLHHSDRGSQYASHAFQDKQDWLHKEHLLEDEKPREPHAKQSAIFTSWLPARVSP
jgi:transposase InsO family protein